MADYLFLYQSGNPEWIKLDLTRSRRTCKSGTSGSKS